jgi:hypothetical protein
MTETQTGVEVTEWAKAHEPDENLIWKSGMWEQVMLVRDNIHMLLVNRYEQRKERPVEVVSSHHSKSVELPVFHVVAEAIGVELWTRGNFFNWQVSVRSEDPVQDCFFRLFNKQPSERDLNPVYFEGFDRAWVFGPYARNPREFSATLGYRSGFLFTFAYLLAEQFSWKQPPKEDW